MDECLDIVCGLWSGQPFEYHGVHYTISPTEFPTIGHTVQQPRVPIWCVGALGREKSMRRAMSWDGVIPQVLDGDGGARQPHLDEVADLRTQLAAARPGDGVDIVVEGTTSEHSPVTAAYDRLRQGPPT